MIGVKRSGRLSGHAVGSVSVNRFPSGLLTKVLNCYIRCSANIACFSNLRYNGYIY